MSDRAKLVFYLTLLLGMVRGAAGADQRPNFLILMADNWAWPHASSLGDPVVKTPVFDALARRGVSFSHAFCTVPSCAPARAVFLTGLHAHRLGPAASLWSSFPRELAVFPDRLEQAGYAVGFSGKGWGPGNFQVSGRERNPAGDKFGSFEEFLRAVPDDKPFCFWFSSRDPHVPWTEGRDFLPHMDPAKLVVPPQFPDHPTVRSDILDYYAEVQNFDRDCGRHLEFLERSGRAEHTIVMMTGDNGWQMPRGLAHIYDTGTRVPLVIAGPGIVGLGRSVDEFIRFEDVSPTLLELAMVASGGPSDGRSLVPLLKGKRIPERDHVFLERERHANVRDGNLSYPVRAIRNRQFLYVRNLRPDRWPAGDPELYFSVGPFGDVDGSPTKDLLLAPHRPADWNRFDDLIFGKRPAEELYDLTQDPAQVRNVAAHAGYAAVKQQLRRQLEDWMANTSDPRVDPMIDPWDEYPYYGNRARVGN